MIWAVGPTGSCAPECGCEDHHRQEEEDAGNLKPDDAADPLEGAQKAAHAADDSASGLPSSQAGCFLDVAASV